MTLAPAPDGGAVVEIRLPAETPQPNTATTPPPSVLTGRTVLVVEDQSFLLELYAELVGALGGVVLQAGTTDQALDAIRGGSVDLVIVSYRLPHDGMQALHRALRAEAPDLASRFVAIVVEPVDSLTRQWLTDQGIPSLAKPFTLDEVQAVSRRLLR